MVVAGRCLHANNSQSCVDFTTEDDRAEESYISQDSVQVLRDTPTDIGVFSIFKSHVLSEGTSYPQVVFQVIKVEYRRTLEC